MFLLACLFGVARMTSSEDMRGSLTASFGGSAIYLAPVVMFVIAVSRGMESARRVGLAILMGGLVVCQVAMLADLRLEYAKWTSFDYLRNESQGLGSCFLVALAFFIPWNRLDSHVSGQGSSRDLPQSLGIAESQNGGDDRQHKNEQPG